MTKRQIKKGFIDLYYSMADEEKARLNWDQEGLYYIFTYASIFEPDLFEALPEDDEELTEEIVEEIDGLLFCDMQDGEEDED